MTRTLTILPKDKCKGGKTWLTLNQDPTILYLVVSLKQAENEQKESNEWQEQNTRYSSNLHLKKTL